MADRNNKTSGSVDGKYYVDRNCIACGACIVDGAEFIAMNHDDAYAFFFFLSEAAEDIAKCEEARLTCPVESIGNDG